MRKRTTTQSPQHDKGNPASPRKEVEAEAACVYNMHAAYLVGSHGTNGTHDLVSAASAALGGDGGLALLVQAAPRLGPHQLAWLLAVVVHGAALGRGKHQHLQHQNNIRASTVLVKPPCTGVLLRIIHLAILADETDAMAWVDLGLGEGAHVSPEARERVTHTQQQQQQQPQPDAKRSDEQATRGCVFFSEPAN